jgi:hypothetical protein
VFAEGDLSIGDDFFCKEDAMKKLFILLLLLLLAVLTAGSVYAQSKIKADIPFAFAVVDKTLPAGAYSAELGSAEPSLFLRGTENSQAVALTFAIGGGLDWNVEPKFVFRRYGEQYFLAQVWMGAGNNVGREISKSAKELSIAQKAPEPELIYVAAK